MKSSFDTERIINDTCIINQNDLFELTIIKPIHKSNKLIIYLPGLNGNGTLVKYFNYPFLNNYYLVSFDQRAQGGNNCKASRRYKKYLNDLNKIILYLKNKLNFISEIYLIGESWGSTLAFLYHKYYKDTINGVVGWNMPYKVVDVSPLKGWSKFKNSLNMIFTFLFNINTFDQAPFNEHLTNNKVLIRIIKTIKRDKLNNKVILAAWRSFKKAWKYLFKTSNKNLMYIQSKQDIMKDDKIISKYEKLNKNFIYLDKGYHILTFDDNVNDKLFEIIKNYLKNKSLS